MNEIGVGVIGTGYMGACHAQAMRSVGFVFEPSLTPRLVSVADVTTKAAMAAKERFGFVKATDSWHDLVEDPDVQIVSVTSPNVLHKEMAMTAIHAGKHVWCEKPLALNAADAREMASAAATHGVVTLVGYNYLRSPAIQYAKKLVDEGVLGEITCFRGIFDEDYMGDPAFPHGWRVQRKLAGSGALGDMGSHMLNLMHFLAGPITSVCSVMHTAIPARRDKDGSEKPVENEDVAEALVRFASGAVGHMGCSRIAWGRKNGFDFELYGTKAGIRFTQERFNEVQFFEPSDDPASNGFRTILTGPPHPPFGRFTPGYGHGIGFNDLKVCEANHLLQAIAGEASPWPDFAEGARVESVCDAILESAEKKSWVDVPTY